jgi:hypothetical protein
MADPVFRSQHPISRRSLLGGAAAVAALALAPTGPAAALSQAASADSLPPLAPLPSGTPVRKLFSPLEQRFGPYLAILPAMVNDIEVNDPETFGYMGGGWWRTPSAPYNARVQEHIYTLSWFYANQRAWNPYAGDPALLGRLDAAIAHQMSLQHPDGSWPEYSIDEHSKAATGFGLGYLAKTLANLRQAGALAARRDEMTQAVRRGIDWFLDAANPIWASPIEYANQNTSGLAAATFALDQDPDPLTSATLRDRIDFLAQNGQSPAGFFYEPFGMDIGYNFEVMLPELAEIYVLTGNRTVLQMAEKFSDWFGYNIVREPDGSGSLSYLAMSARTTVAYYDDVVPDPDKISLASRFIPEVPSLAAFFTSKQDRAATRHDWAEAPGPVAGLAKQNTSPRFPAHATYGEALPTSGAKKQAIARLPYLRSDEFVELRRDMARKQDYLYVRRPAFYLGSFFGTRPTTLTRGGMGFLWHPQAGMIVSSGQDDTTLWSTLLPNGNADGHAGLDAVYLIGDRALDAQSSSPDEAPVTVRYQIPDGRIRTELTMTRNTVTRAVQATATGTEQIPLVLQPDDTVSFADGTPVAYGAQATATASGLTIRRGHTTIVVDWGIPLRASVEATATTFLRDGRRRRHVLRIPHNGTLTTTITMR